VPEYYNHNSYPVHLTGPDGRIVTVKPKEELDLPEFYDQYVGRGFIRRRGPAPQALQARPSSIQQREQQRRRTIVDNVRVRTQHRPPPAPPRPVPQAVVRHSASRPVVGRELASDALKALVGAMSRCGYPISDGIGVGVLSYNRADSLRRLIASIDRFTDLGRTTVFVSDDGSTCPQTRAYLQELSHRTDLVVLRNQHRLGIAGNTNRLLRCLERFPYFLLLNDDVEVLQPGWEKFYPDALRRGALHHLIYRQPGVYGAELGHPARHGQQDLTVVQDRPHGAVLAATGQMLRRCGFFDEAYGLYGMEHVDWSSRAWELGLQPAGFFDVPGSSRYFRIWPDASAVADRATHLSAARTRFASRTGGHVPATDSSLVPAISCIVPFRNVGRTGAVDAVLNNLRAQRFPVVELVLVEQDSARHVDEAAVAPVQYLHLPGLENKLFNKSLAFNAGVRSSRHPLVVLHDADTMAQGDYLERVYRALQEHEAVHLGARVIYTTQDSCAELIRQGRVPGDCGCDRVVGYFEGGSLGLLKETYWRIGGFNEDFWGYGCEDCDFYYRMAGATKFLNRRELDFLHLWHPRSDGWQAAHEANKKLEAGLRALDLQVYLRTQRQRVSKYLRGGDA